MPDRTSTSPKKESLRDELARLVEADLSVAERAQRTTQQAATHEEAKPENDKDTRAVEQSYLARGQAQRVEDLRSDLAEVRRMPVRALAPDAPVALGALVTALEADATLVLFVAPAHGGAELAGSTVQVVTPRSPLGRALLGKRAGDDCDLKLPQKTRELSIVCVE